LGPSPPPRPRAMPCPKRKTSFFLLLRFFFDFAGLVSPSRFLFLSYSTRKRKTPLCVVSFRVLVSLIYSPMKFFPSTSRVCSSQMGKNSPQFRQLPFLMFLSFPSQRLFLYKNFPRYKRYSLVELSCFSIGHVSREGSGVDHGFLFMGYPPFSQRFPPARLWPPRMLLPIILSGFPAAAERVCFSAVSNSKNLPSHLPPVFSPRDSAAPSVFWGFTAWPSVSDLGLYPIHFHSNGPSPWGGVFSLLHDYLVLDVGCPSFFFSCFSVLSVFRL